MPRWGSSSSSSSSATDETMRIELDLKLKQNELSLLEEVVASTRSLTPLITDLGLLSKLILAGAGGLVCLWGLSEFCRAVVLPFLKKKEGKGKREGEGEGEEV